MVLIEGTPGRQRTGSSHPREDGERDATVIVLDREELTETVESTLTRAGCTLEQLREQARSGEFSSEANWRTWFCISPFVG